MAGYKSDLITKAEAAQTKQSAGVVNADDKSGVVLYATCLVTLASTMAAAEIIQLVDLPDGAVPIPQLSHVSSNALGTNLTLSIGDVLVPGRYAVGLAKTAGGQLSFSSTAVQPVAAIAPYRIDPAVKGDNRIIATITTATAITNGVVLSITIAYRGKA